MQGFTAVRRHALQLFPMCRVCQIFPDDLLLFARSRFEAIFMLETLMEELAYVGLCLNAGKTVVLTNEAQPPQCF